MASPCRLSPEYSVLYDFYSCSVEAELIVQYGAAQSGLSL